MDIHRFKYTHRIVNFTFLPIYRNSPPGELMEFSNLLTFRLDYPFVKLLNAAHTPGKGRDMTE